MKGRSGSVGLAAPPLTIPGPEIWLLSVGVAALVVPTAVSLATQEWSLESGAHGPIVLALGGWLVWRQLPALRNDFHPGSLTTTFATLSAALLMYVFGRTCDFLTLEAGGLYGVGLALLHSRFGLAGLRRIWFPVLYIAFAIPAPRALLDTITAPLKHLVTYLATSGLSLAGLPVARQGVTIVVGQYELFVADACSGLNSLVGLTAISLLYVYLMRGPSLVYSLLLTALTVPVAVAANVIRVALLVVVTYVFGEEVGQSFVHFAAGIVLFTSALLLMFAIDRAIHALGHRIRRG
jgi:exosortase